MTPCLLTILIINLLELICFAYYKVWSLLTLPIYYNYTCRSLSVCLVFIASQTAGSIRLKLNFCGALGKSLWRYDAIGILNWKASWLCPFWDGRLFYAASGPTRNLTNLAGILGSWNNLVGCLLCSGHLRESLVVLHKRLKYSYTCRFVWLQLLCLGAMVFRNLIPRYRVLTA